MITETLNNLLHQTAFFNLDWGNYVMIAVACFFLYLAIKHEFEPLLLVPIAFGMLLVNIYPDIMAEPYTDVQGLEHAGGLFYYFFTLDEWSILPSLIFMGVGAMTDFGPLQHSLVSIWRTFSLFSWDSMEERQQLSPSSAVPTARLLSSF